MTAEPASKSFEIKDAVAPPQAKRRRWRRYGLMLSLPLLLALGGGYMWLMGGRYVSTDDAYVQQDKVAVSSDVSGRLVEVDVRENDMVRKGDVLFRIDPEPFRIALEQAQAAVASARLEVEKLRAAHETALAQVTWDEDNLKFKRTAFARQQSLLAKGVAARSTFDEAENELHSAEQALAQARQQVESAKAALGGDPALATDDHPDVKAAIARRDQAALDLTRTTVVAASDGMISQSSQLLVGRHVMTGTALLSLVDTRRSWVEANFKETDLTYMMAGQSAEVTLDTYPDHAFQARVESIGAGTGSDFSILPAQNATGNWVKVVQRVPVRLRIEGAPDLALRSGLSATVDVDTGRTRSFAGFSAYAADGAASVAK